MITKTKATWIASLSLFLIGFVGLSQNNNASADDAPKPDKPNFLIIVADDMGYSDPGCYGGEIETPNLDSLAEDGLRFTQFYSTGRCWPSRTCILTGYYAQQVGMDPPKGRPDLPSWTPFISSFLKPQGYMCYTSGKWHVFKANKPTIDADFDRSYVIHDHDRFFSPKNQTMDGEKLPPVERDSGFYLTSHIADVGIDFLKEHEEKDADKPFFLYLAFTCPHFPLMAKPEDIDKYRDKYKIGWDEIRKQRHQRMLDMGLVNCKLSPLRPEVVASWSFPEEKLQEMIGPGEEAHAIPWNDLTDVQKEYQATKMAIHAAMVDCMDQSIGRVLEQLKAMGDFDNTVIFFVSDNGASGEQIIRGDMHDKSAPLGSAGSYLCLGPGWSTAANTPFSYHKSWNHEGGISSPLIVHWPKGIEAHGELRNSPGHFIDLMPTIIDLAGTSPDSIDRGENAPPLPGKSLVPAFKEDVTIERPYIFFHHTGNRALRVGDMKIAAAGTDGPWELYNIKEDRAEMNDLSKQMPEKLKEMVDLWQKLEDKYKAMSQEK